MRGKPAPDLAFNAALVQADMIGKGWNPSQLARRAGLSHMTVHRFLKATHQTPDTAKKIARALGFSIGRYLVVSSRRVPA